MAEDDKKKPGGPPGETTLDSTQQRDPDEAVLAEQAIHHYVSDVIERFVGEVDNAFGLVQSHLGSLEQVGDLNNIAICEGLGGEMVQEMLEMFGGMDSPIAQAVAGDLYGAASQNARGGQIFSMVSNMGYALRDAAWSLRDNLQSILSGEWDELRDMAYEGETAFIGLLHSLGLPAVELTSRDIADQMIDKIDDMVEGLPKQAEQKVEEAAPAVAEAEAKKEEEKEPIAQQVMEEEEKEELLA